MILRKCILNRTVVFRQSVIKKLEGIYTAKIDYHHVIKIATTT